MKLYYLTKMVQLVYRVDCQMRSFDFQSSAIFVHYINF